MGKFIWFGIGGFIGWVAGFPSGIYFAVESNGDSVLVRVISNIKYVIEVLVR